MSKSTQRMDHTDDDVSEQDMLNLWETRLAVICPCQPACLINSPWPTPTNNDVAGEPEAASAFGADCMFHISSPYPPDDVQLDAGMSPLTGK